MLWETEVADGWLALPATARQLLVRLGAEPPPATAPAATSTRAVTSGPPVSDAGRWRPSTYVVAGGVLAVVVLVGAAVALRRSLWRG